MNISHMRKAVLNYSLLLVVAFTAVLAGCERQEQERTPAVRPVRILTIDDGSIGRNLAYSGQIRAGETAELGFEVAGRIIELPVMEGQDVNEGDMLARLDPADYQARLNQADANFRQAQVSFERFNEIVESGAVSRQQVDLRKRNYEVAEAELATARKALNDTRLIAPFTGQIGRRLVDNFVNVQAKEGVVILQDLTMIEVVISIPEQDWARADPNMSKEERTRRVRPMISLTMIPDREFPARIKEVATVADPVTRTFEVIAAMDNPSDVSILPGMTANVTISVPEGGTSSEAGAAFSIPASAVLADEQGNSTVWKVDAGTMTVSRVTIELGDMAGSQVRVLSGLNPGDRIAASGVHNLREGMQITELRQ